jgi:hypothetical protein
MGRESDELDGALQVHPELPCDIDRLFILDPDE